jgi:carbon starvation protein
MFGIFVTKASSIADSEQAFALYLDAGLVAMVALLAVIVLGDSIRQWYGYLVLKQPFTSSEVVVMAGGGSPGRLRPTIRDDDEPHLPLPGGGCC